MDKPACWQPQRWLFRAIPFVGSIVAIALTIVTSVNWRHRPDEIILDQASQQTDRATPARFKRRVGPRREALLAVSNSLRSTMASCSPG